MHGFNCSCGSLQATPESDIFERAMIDRLPLDDLHASLVGAGGQLVLLGDSAHAMHSGPGQGGRMAFEVRVVCGRVLTAQPCHR
jgi:2-polyprenyl-6-methoxyphenol hydroxylase-like FAD-dependent oxidoreductase